MAIDLTGAGHSTDRINISKRMVMIPKETSVLSETNTNLTARSTEQSSVDVANTTFLNHWLNLSNRYLNEREDLNGVVCDTFTAGEVTNAFITAGDTNKFYPNTSSIGLADNNYIIPQINIYTADVITPRTYSTFYEQWVVDAFLKLKAMLQTGLPGGHPTTTLSANYLVSAPTALSVANASNIQIGDILLLEKPAPSPNSRCVYVIDKDGTDLTVRPIGTYTGSDIPLGATVHISTAAIWSNAQRAAFPTVASYPVAAAGIDNFMMDPLVLAALLADEAVQLNANDDSRSPHAANIVTAKANVATISGAYSTWAGSANPYQDTALNIFGPFLTTRGSQITARITQIQGDQSTTFGAIGKVTDTSSGGIGSYTLESGAVAYKYSWLNTRIHKTTGSLATKRSTDLVNTLVGQQISQAGSILDSYEELMFAVPFTENADGTNVVWLDATGRGDGSITDPIVLLKAGDSVWVCADGQAEAPSTSTAGTLMSISPNGKALLSFNISEAYTTAKNARLYKLL